MTDNIDKIKTMIDNALADRRLSRQDSNLIRNAIYSDGMVTREKIRLWRELQTKVTNGEILLEN
ncbi:hypothetical protein AA637_10435 [Cyanobacterium sp. HL-69]|uniref:hypothetical protein n=1 Tax=unclassified Cyanobacterium TaxID=2629879 RepID=UPI00085277D2|nr:hypothetical protein [Cyanobacterium sp. IPPAS B-1200]AUC61545.1 hypothetical protein AA637_10435 [Cyanobacterium sp. HL-69]OEJ78218.1 hypothetical protein A5482_02995 [Cyanobacterium sp. IPPAS B-1200]